MTIGFTPNDVPFVSKTACEDTDADRIDFQKMREELLSLESVERKDATDDYNRTHRGS